MDTKRTVQRLKLATLVATFAFATACDNARTPVALPATPAADTSATGKPTINFFAVEPSSTVAGKPVSLRWSVKNAASVQIEPEIGQVQRDDNHVITPQETTTYRLMASNPAGVVESVVTVNVIKNTTTEAIPESATAEQAAARMLKSVSGLADVHFEYNSDDIHASDLDLLRGDATAIKGMLDTDRSLIVRIEGHCDERGSDEYNVGLSDRRATAVKDALMKFGVPESRLETTGFGKELPVCTDATEDCYARNRRAHFSADRLTAQTTSQ